MPYASSASSGVYVSRNLSPPPPVTDVTPVTPSSFPTASDIFARRASVARMDDPSGIQRCTMNWLRVDSGKKFCFTFVNPNAAAASIAPSTIQVSARCSMQNSRKARYAR